jgi:hypothetical protein
LLAGWIWEERNKDKWYKFSKTTTDLRLKQINPNRIWWLSDVGTFTEETILANPDFFKVEYEPEEPRFYFGNYPYGENATYQKNIFNRFVQWCRETTGQIIPVEDSGDLWYVVYDREAGKLRAGCWYSMFGGVKLYYRESADLFIKELSRPENQSWYYWYIKQLEKVDL